MKVLELLSLKGRNALVTGGSRGLGMQMAEALGEMGARVAITARKQDELGEAVSRLSKQGISATAYVCDMGRREAILPAVEQILRDFGKIDINGGPFNMNAPFGGFKQSGHGREAGKYGLEEFLEYKSLQLKPS